MYAGKAETVDVPERNVHILKNGYVYWTSSGHWDKEKNRTVDDRRSIGKLDPGNPAKMYPNKAYFTFYLVSEKDAEKQQLFRNDSSPDPGTAPSLTVFREPGRFSEVMNFGPFLAITLTARNMGTLFLLKKFFPGLQHEILALALHSIDEESSVAQDFPYWAFSNYCGLDKPLSSGEISIVYEKIAADPEAIQNFLYFHKEAYHKRIHEGGETILAFDSTNQNTSSREIPLEEHGHPKVNKHLPDINTALFVDEETGIPLYYEHFCGSILDKSETPYTMERVRDLGFKKLFLMMDRGYFSQKTIEAMKDNSFGLMCPDNLNFVKEIIAGYSAAIRDQEDCYIASENVYGIHLPDYRLGDSTYDAYLYYDPARAEDERGSIHARVSRMIRLAEGRKRYSEKLVKLYSPWLIITKARKTAGRGRNFTVKENKAVIQENISEAGFFVILSNAGLETEQMIRIARMRDRGEKAFRRIKSHFGLAQTYVHQASTYEGKMFVAFVALILIESYRWFIRKELNAISSTTTATTLGEMRKLQIRMKPDKTWMQLYALTSRQKKILQDLQVSEDDIDTLVRAVRVRV